MKKTTARFPGNCGICKKQINVGDTIGQPFVKNGNHGNLFSGCWYHENCANAMEEIGPRNGPYINSETFDADNEQARSILKKHGIEN